MSSMKRNIISFIAVSVLFLITVYYSIFSGSIHVSIAELVNGLITGTDQDVQVIKDLRFPRIIIAIFAGAALSVAGVLLQAVLRNPLAEPGIIGISAGAGFMGMLMVAIFPTLFFFTPLFSFIGGAIAFFIVYIFSWKSGLNPLRMVLIGVAVNAIFTSLSQTFNYRGSYTSSLVVEVTTSTLAMKKWSEVEMIVMYGSIGLVLALLVFSWCNYLVLEDKTAKSLGFNVNLARFSISAIAVLLASIATATAGMFLFVGLIVPHIGRLLVGNDHKLLIPFSAILGALLILLSDTIGRTIIVPNEIPASIIMSLIGGPFLIFLLRKSDRIYGS